MLKPPRNWRFFILQKAVLKDIVDFFNMLIGVEGGEDSCGSTGPGRPRRRKCAEEAPRHARGKRSRLKRKSTFKINTAKNLNRLKKGPNKGAFRYIRSVSLFSR